MEGGGLVCFKVLPEYLPRETEENDKKKKTSVMITSDLVNINLNTSLDHYCYTNILRRITCSLSNIEISR